MVCRVITCFIEYKIGWTDVNDKELMDTGIDTHYITLEKLLEEIGDKKGISLRIDDELPAKIPYKLSQCVKRLRLDKIRMTGKHNISKW